MFSPNGDPCNNADTQYDEGVAANLHRDIEAGRIRNLLQKNWSGRRVWGLHYWPVRLNRTTRKICSGYKQLSGFPAHTFASMARRLSSFPAAITTGCSDLPQFRRHKTTHSQKTAWLIANSSVLSIMKRFVFGWRSLAASMSNRSVATDHRLVTNGTWTKL